MAEIGAFGGAGLGVGLAEGLRFGPGVKDGGRVPDRVGGVERVVVVGGAAQEVKFAEAGHLVEIGFALAPELFKDGFAAEGDLETVHGDIHGISLFRILHLLVFYIVNLV